MTMKNAQQWDTIRKKITEDKISSSPVYKIWMIKVTVGFVRSLRKRDIRHRTWKWVSLKWEDLVKFTMFVKTLYEPNCVSSFLWRLLLPKFYQILYLQKISMIRQLHKMLNKTNNSLIQILSTWRYMEIK